MFFILVFFNYIKNLYFKKRLEVICKRSWRNEFKNFIFRVKCLFLGIFFGNSIFFLRVFGGLGNVVLGIYFIKFFLGFIGFSYFGFKDIIDDVCFF